MKAKLKIKLDEVKNEDKLIENEVEKAEDMITAMDYNPLERSC